MKKNFLYLNIDYEHYFNKTNAQLKSFNNYYNCFLMYIKDNKIIVDKIDDGNYICIKTIDILNKNKYKLVSNVLYECIVDLNIDFLYIRRIGIRFIYFNFKKISKKTRIIYEIPTLPFDKTNSLIVNVVQKIEWLYLKFFVKKYIFIFAVILQKRLKLPNNVVIFNNGVIIDKYNIKERVIRSKKENELKLVGIAHLNNWHGYDRIIKSIEKEKKLNVTFTIYSEETEETKKLNEYICKHELQDKIIISRLPKENIIKIINNFDLAVGGIGYFRRNAEYDTSIKNKEYCAMAIPFIICLDDTSFNDNFKYLYKIPATNDQVDINSINNWINNLIKENFCSEMYEYAKNNLTYDLEVERINEKINELSK